MANMGRRDRAAIMRNQSVTQIRLEPPQRRIYGIHAAIAGHDPRKKHLRAVELVPGLDLGLPRRLIAESGVAVGAHDGVAASQLIPGGMDLIPRDAAAPLPRIPERRATVRAVAGREDEALSGLHLDPRRVVILGPVEAGGDTRVV